MSAIVSFGASVFTDLSAKVEGNHIEVSTADCSLSALLNIDEAEELAAELNQAIAGLRANQRVGRK